MKITDKEKDKNYFLPIILSACVVISACGVIFFLKHRKNKRK
jgi:cell division protein FtsL